jgi:hypothetical protein
MCLPNGIPFSQFLKENSEKIKRLCPLNPRMTSGEMKIFGMNNMKKIIRVKISNKHAIGLRTDCAVSHVAYPK